jgi:hypothetical protein
MAKPRPWHQHLQIIAWAVGGMAALGTATVVAARYITLPERVEAGEQKNSLQDEAILELKKSNEIWQNIYQQQQRTPHPHGLPERFRGLRETGEDGTCWVCASSDRDECYEQYLWRRCEE